MDSVSPGLVMSPCNDRGFEMECDFVETFIRGIIIMVSGRAIAVMKTDEKTLVRERLNPRKMTSPDLPTEDDCWVYR